MMDQRNVFALFPSEFFAVVLHEMQRADDRYGPFTSTHEGYGVLCEEVAELLDAIRANDLGAVRREAIQVAAVAARLALACEQPAAERSRK